MIYLCVLCARPVAPADGTGGSAVNTGFLGIAVWTGLTGSTGCYAVAVGYSSNSAFDNENGHLLGLFYSSNVHHKDLYV